MLWISSTEKDKWINEAFFDDEKGSELIIGDENGKGLFGFGCCISEICAKAIFSLTEDKQSRFLMICFQSKVVVLIIAVFQQAQTILLKAGTVITKPKATMK